MKHLLSVFLLFCISIFGISCGNQNQGDEENPMADNNQEIDREIPSGDEFDSVFIEIDESSENLEREINTMNEDVDQLLEEEN